MRECCDLIGDKDQILYAHWIAIPSLLVVAMLTRETQYWLVWAPGIDKEIQHYETQELLMMFFLKHFIE